MSEEIEKPTETLVVLPAKKGLGFDVSLTPAAIQLKNDLLLRASAITAITTPEEQQIAMEITALLKGFSKQTEDFRKKVKEPYFKTGQAIDKQTKKFIEEVDNRAEALELMLKNYYLQQQEQEKIFAEIDAAEASEESGGMPVAILMDEPAKIKGATIKDKVTFEVTDIEAFYQWDLQRRLRAQAINRTLPTFVHLEIRRADFNQFINLMDDATLDSIPGVKFTKDTNFAVRTAKPTTFE